MALLIIGLVLFVMLVVVHEFGHYIVARRNGVEVEEFGIGFPPRAKVLTKKKGTVYTLNWLPLGGFVKLKGEHDSDTEPGTFGSARLWVKAKILLAGVGMNLVTAFVLFTILALLGMPKVVDNQFTVASDTKVAQQEVLIGYVEPDSPAEESGLQVRDELISIGLPGHSNIQLTGQDQLPDATKSYAGEQVEVIIERDGQTQTKAVQLRSEEEVEASKKTDEPKGYLGVSPTEYQIRRSTWSAPIVAAGLMVQFTELTLKGLGTALAGLFTGNTAQATEQVSGPVGVFVLLKDGAFFGYQFILFIIAIISLTLAIMNALPIPALDGGRLFVTAAFRAAKKPLRPKTEDLIHGGGFAALMLLFVLITIVDVRRFF